MAKKKKNKLFSLSNLLCIAALALGVVAVGMIAMATINIEGSVGSLKGTTGFTGIKVVFGSEKDLTLFSFMNLIPYILLVVGVLLMALKVHGKMNNGLINIVAVALFVGAGVMFILAPNFTIFTDAFTVLLKAGIKTGLVKKTLAMGGLVSAICSFAAGACSLVSMFVKK